MHPSEAAAGPDTSVHGAFKREWKTSDEINWKKNFQIWMKWVKTSTSGAGRSRRAATRAESAASA